jgi:rod shape determining protein RodA
MVAILEKRNYRDFDWLVAFLAIAIVCFGIWQIYNAQPTMDYWSKQILGLIIALIALFVIAVTDYRRVIDAAPFFYGFGLLLLILVLIPGLGVKINGQRAWLLVPLSADFSRRNLLKLRSF